ncbi:MAG: AraC family transcriptional regulator [Verrucomicrobiota bacterium]
MDIVSKTRHPGLWKSSVAAVSERLADAVLNSREIGIGTLRLSCVQCHLGPGLYSKSHDPGLHQHADSQIEIPLAGRFGFSVEQSNVPLKTAQALLIPRLTMHTWHTSGGFMLGIQFSVKDAFGKETSLPLIGKLCSQVVSTPALTAHLRQLMDLVAFRRGSPLTPVLSSSLLMILIAEVLDEACRFSKNPEAEAAGRGRLLYDRTCAFITSNLERSLTARDLAIQAGVSFRQIARIFLQYGNESPHQSILRLRLDRAQAMIEKDPAIPIKEVAYACGFSSPAHFSMAFKKSCGVSPSTYAARKVVRR